ncbi:hypothetical protein [Methylobacterium iners]|uniref:Heme exporter protein D n=1 Tax=Methylobacterium iners TaxID=418707 RepID=A0ABQ4RWL8_9HYPH|nr:hypothetical protein [Methylobacterium iners]GJD94603.1 hypothetical protein OCOJLMKI_1806 [Methylobacterium iners]
MSEAFYGVFEILLAFGLVLGIAIWQLVVLKRSIRRDKAEAAARSRQADPP